MADRYWVGGTDSWDATAGTKWATTSGGAGGASVPTTNDDVYFDAASGTVTCTLVGSRNCRSLNFTGFTGTFAGGVDTLSIYGNLIFSLGMTLTGLGKVNFYGTSSFTITTAGKTLPNTEFITTSGTYTLQDAFTSSGSITVTQGTFTTNNFNVTAQSLLSTNSNTRTINLGSSTVTLTGAATVLSFATNTNLTFNAGTSTIVCTSTNANIIGGAAGGTGVTFYNVSYTATTAGSNGLITSTNTFNNLSFTGSSSAGVRSVTFDSNQTINGTLSTTGTAGNRRVWFASNTYGVRRTLTVNSAPSLTDADFRDIIVNGTAAPISGTRIGNRGACAGITFSAPKTVYWNLAGAQNWSANGWAATSTGTPSTDYFPLAQDTATFTNAGSVTGTITIDTALPYTGTVDMSGRTSAMTLSFASSGITCYGSWLNGSGTAFTAGNANGPTFSGDGSKTITSAGKFFPGRVTIDAYGGVVTLNDAIRANGSGSFGQFTVTNGTFDTAGYSLQCSQITSNNSNVRAIYLRNSTVTTTWNQGGIDFTTSTNLSFNAGTSLINCATDNGTIGGGGQTFYNVSFNTAGNGSIRGITGNNTFNNLTLIASSTGVTPYSIGGTQTISGTLTCTGSSATQRAFVRSDTIGTTRTITANAISANDCDFRDITIGGSAAGSSPTRAGDCGGNSGINFPAPKTVYWNLAGSQNWSATAWATSSGGTPAVNNFPLAQDTAVFDNAGAAATAIINANYNIGTIDMSARTSAMTLNSSANAISYGNFTLGSGVTISGLTFIAFSGRGTQTFTSAGKTITFPITVDSFSGTFQLGDALNCSGTLTLTSGTFDAVTYNVTATLFSSSNSNVRTLRMGSGLWTLTGTGNVWGLGTTTNLTFLKGTADILLSDTSTTARTFSGGGLSYNKLTIGGATGTSTTTINQNNQFTELASTKTVAHTIDLGPGTTQVFGKWSVTGTAGNVVSIAGTAQIQLVGSSTSGIDYLSISGGTAVSTGAAGPGQFFAGANSTGGGTGFILTATPAPRTLYWVGGTGNWSNTARWSLSSGGAGGEPIPRTLDDVIFDSASNATAYTVTVDAASRCNQLTISAPASGNVTLAGSSALICHGNVTLPATGLTRTWSGQLILSGSTTGKTFTTNGVTLASAITVNGVGCGWTLGSALSSSGTFTVTNGAFDTANYAVDCSQFLSTNSNARSVSLGSSTINATAGVNFTTSLNLTFNSGTSSIVSASSGGTVNGGNQTFYNVSFANTSTGTRIITGANTFNNLTLNASATGLTQLSINANQTITGTLTCSGSSAIARGFVLSDTIGTTRTLTVNNFAAGSADIDFRDTIIAGSAAPISGTRFGDCGGNSGITFPAPKTVYWNLAGSQNWSATGWAATSGGTPAVNNFPLAQDTAVIDDAGLVGSITIQAFNIGTLDASARTSSVTFGHNNSATFYGSYIIGSGVTIGGAQAQTFAGRGTMTFTSAGKTITFTITVDTPTGTFQLGDALTMATGFGINFISGTLDAVSYNVTINGLNSNNTTVRTLNMGSGLWTLTGTSSSPWNLGTPTNFTLNKGTADILLSDTSTTARTFAGSGLAYNKLTIGGATGISTTTIIGNNTFTEIASTKTVAHTIALGTTSQRVGAFTVTGTAGNVVTITGNTSNLIYTGGGLVGAGVDYLNVQGRVYGPNGETSGIWYAGANSVNSGSLGWEFTAGGSVIYNVVITEAYTSAEEQDTAANIFNGDITEDTVLADTIVPNGIFGVTITENSNLADSSTPAAILYVSVTEPTTLANFQEFVNLIAVSITEGSIAGDTSNSNRAFLSSISEGVTSAETQSTTYTFLAVAVENLTSNNTQTVQAVFAGRVSEGVVSAEAINVSGIFGSSILEVLTSLSQESVSLNTNAAITEGVEVTDGKEIIDWLNNSSDIVNWLNNSSDIVYWGVFGPRAVLVRFVDQAENVTIADLSERQATLSALITEALAAADSSSVSAIFNSLINENMLVSDQMVGYGWFRIVDDQTASWTSVDNSQSITWTNIGDDQNPNWVEINNSQP